MTLHPDKTSPTHGIGRLDWEAKNKKWVVIVAAQVEEEGGVTIGRRGKGVTTDD